MRPRRQQTFVTRVIATLAFSVALSGCILAPVNADRNAFANTPALNAIPRGEIYLRPAEMLLLDVRLDRQVSENGCGAHAVAALIEYWERLAPSGSTTGPVTGVEIYAQTPPRDASGYSLGEIADLLSSYGLEALVVNATIDSLKAELRVGRPAIVRVKLAATELRYVTILPPRLPVLAEVETRAFEISSWMFRQDQLDHYWLIIGFDAERLVVLDPAMGVRSVTPEAFDAAFQAGGQLAVVSGGPKSG